MSLTADVVIALIANLVIKISDGSDGPVRQRLDRWLALDRVQFVSASGHSDKRSFISAAQGWLVVITWITFCNSRADA